MLVFASPATWIFIAVVFFVFAMTMSRLENYPRR
jgi:hypothetical protein